MLSKDEARRVTDRAIAASKADEVHVGVSGGETTHVRFARNAPSTAGNYTDRHLSVRSVFGRRSGTFTVNQLDDASIALAVARSEEIARLAPEDPEHMPALGAQSYPSVDAYRDSVLERGAEQLADGVANAISVAEQRGLVAAGFGTARATTSALGNSAGLFGYHRSTTASFSQTVRTTDGKGSGWSSGVGREVGDIDFPSTIEVATRKAETSADPQPLDPGKYVTILEPACVASLVQMFLYGMNARSADEGRSFFSKPGGGNRLGEKLFGDDIHISSDPSDAQVPGSPWGTDGLPQQARTWVDGGVVSSLSYDRFWADKNGVAPVPFPSNTIMKGGSGTVQDLIASTKRGVLITSLWYIRGLDPRTMLYTGLTRDGVFWIENGKIARPLTNFRWNDSPVAVLKNVDAMSAAVRVSPRSRRSPTVMVPALRVKEFELSSVSEAV